MNLKLIRTSIAILLLAFTLPQGTIVCATNSDGEASNLPLANNNCNGTVVNVTRFDNGTTVVYYDNGTIRKEFEFVIAQQWHLVDTVTTKITPAPIPLPSNPLTDINLVLMIVYRLALIVSVILGVLGIKIYINWRKRPDFYTIIRKIKNSRVIQTIWLRIGKRNIFAFLN